MTQQELIENCTLSVLSEECLRQCNTFDCGSSEDEQDLNDFFANDAYLVEDERLEAKYVGIGVGHLPLHTRLMYFDLLNMVIVEE